MLLEKDHIKLISISILILCVRLAGGIGADFSYLILAIIALCGGKHTIYAYILCWFITMINPVIAPSGSLGAIGRFLVVFCGFIPVVYGFIYKKEKRVYQYILLTFILGIFVLIHSIIISNMPSISILKLVMWLITIVTLFSCWARLSEVEYVKVYENIINFLKFVILLSLPFLAIPLVGFARNGTGFQGILNHPQAFGPTVSILGAVLLSKLLTERVKNNFEIFVIILIFPLIILSEARTAGLALIISISLSLIINNFLLGKKMRDLYIFKKKSTYIVIAAMPILIYPFMGLILEKLSVYFLKRTDSETFAEMADNSRGKLVDNMLFNIVNNPLSGIGFGMPSTEDNILIDYDPFFGIPIGAAIEKGVMPIAVIEELGLILGGIVIIWLLYGIYKCRKMDLKTLTVILCLILLNFGEYMFFSVGGMGMLILIMYTASVSKTFKKV